MLYNYLRNPSYTAFCFQQWLHFRDELYISRSDASSRSALEAAHDFQLPALQTNTYATEHGLHHPYVPLDGSPANCDTCPDRGEQCVKPIKYRGSGGDTREAEACLLSSVRRTHFDAMLVRYKIYLFKLRRVAHWL